MKTLSERVRYVLANLEGPDRGKQVRLADIAGCTRGLVNQWLNTPGQSMGYPYAKNISDKLGYAVDWLIEGNQPIMGGDKDWSDDLPLFSRADDSKFNASQALPISQGRFIAIVGTARGGADGFFSIDDYPPGQGDGEILTHSPDRAAYAIRVRGDSMRPRIKSGEYIIAEPTIEAQPGDDVVVRLKDDRAMVKELLWMRDGEVSLGSINNGVAPITLPLNEIKSIHRVAAIIPRGSALLK